MCIRDREFTARDIEEIFDLRVLLEDYAISKLQHHLTTADMQQLIDCLSCEAREAGVFLANMVRYQRTAGRRIALIAGGETCLLYTSRCV